MPTNKPEVVLPEDLRLLIVCDTQFGWNGQTTLKVEELERLAARGWLKEGIDYYEYEVTEAGRKLINDTLTRPAAGDFHECQHCKSWSRTNAQQPAEAVAEYQYRKPGAHDDSWHRMTREEYEASLATGHCCGIASWTKNFELRKLYTTPPQAIDIGKLRELETAAKQALELLDRPEVAKALHGLGFLNTRAALREAVAAALIGDGGEAKK